MNFFKDLPKDGKINIFFGNFLTKFLNYPSKKDLTKLLIKDMKDSVRGYIKDDTSLFQTAQLYLDGLSGSKNTMQKKIKRAYEQSTSNLGLDNFFESEKINAIFSTDYDLTLENVNAYKVQKITPINDVSSLNEKTIKLYKVLGDVTRYDLMFITNQDFKKLKLLDLHKNFFSQIRKELEMYPTVIMDIDLDDTDFMEVLEFILKDVENRENICATIGSKVYKTKSIEKLKELGIKLLTCTEKELYSELKEFLSIDFNIDEEEEINIFEKKFVR